MSAFTTEHYDPRLHLFLDDEEIRQVFAVRRELGRLTMSAQPIMTPGGPEAPWEDGRLFAPYAGSVIPDPVTGKLRMYYWCFGDHTGLAGMDLADVMMACVAESEDGLAWYRPRLGLVEWRGSKDNNIFLTGRMLAKGDPDALHDVRGTTMIDANDRRMPYKMVAWGQNIQAWDATIPADRLEKLRSIMGYYLLESADGLRWSQPRWLMSGGDTFTCSWDPKRRLYIWANRMPTEGNALNWYVRMIEMLESKDLRNWQHVGRAMVLGEEANFGVSWQHWGMMPFQYGNEYLGLLGVTYQQGLGIEIVLAASRDGRHWHMPLGTQRFLPVGELGSWCGETLNVSCNPPLRARQGRGADRLFIYYTARNSDQQARATAHNYLGVATMPADRFVAMTAGQEGFIITEPIEVAGPRLYVNMQNTYGYVQVEVRDAENRPIEGYETASCPKMRERGAAVPVAWQTKSDLRELIGRRCVFKFTVAQAALFAYRFGEEANEE